MIKASHSNANVIRRARHCLRNEVSRGARASKAIEEDNVHQDSTQPPVITISSYPQEGIDVGPPQRRSSRDISAAHLHRTDVKRLLSKICANDDDTIVLKVKDHLLADVHSVVVDAIIAALESNTVCQALYLQNLTPAVGDSQLRLLVQLLQKKPIWCLNIGENYEVSTAGWISFTQSLPLTSVTHLYASEHVIKLSLKNEMRAHIRANRKKHSLHCSMDNLAVIERCTHMWWCVASSAVQCVFHMCLAVCQPNPSDEDGSPLTSLMLLSILMFPSLSLPLSQESHQLYSTSARSFFRVGQEAGGCRR